MASDVRGSYSERADEYIRHFGSLSSVHPSDLQLVSTWAEQANGMLLDAGCGPGQWTNYLAGRGFDSMGIDQLVPFIEHARTTYAGVPFEVGSIDALPYPSDSVGGVLAWYSLIHVQPHSIQTVLAEFARVLTPGGSLLVGYFVGPRVEAFEHSVSTAFSWSAEALTTELQESGFEVIEAHTRTGNRPKPRPHGAIVARLSAGG